MQVEWQVRADLSVLHAAWCVQHFTDRAAHCPSGLRDAGSGWASFPERLGVRGEQFWETLFTLSGTTEGWRMLANRLLQRLGRQDHAETLSALQAQLAQSQAALQQAFPRMEQELPLRRGPLEGQWQAHGPGLLHLLGRFTEPRLIVESATVMLVQPILSGAGYAHLDTNRVHFEAVLTNPLPELPETLRLAWLLAQLNCDLPAYSELINRFDLRRIAGLAFLPPTLKAGQELGLCPFTVDAVNGALSEWHADCLGHADPQDLAEKLMVWWETYESSQADWRIALTGLGQLLPEGGV